MIVYGDHAISIDLADVVDAFGHRLANGAASHDERRARLVFAGQLEQAVSDADLPCAQTCRALTRAAAEDLVEDELGVGAASRREHRHMRRMLEEVSRVTALMPAARRQLSIRTPEGFSWYALYPEAYVQAAEAWLTAHPGSSKRVLVVGIRSIGTTLAAVVAAKLRARGIGVADLTVRPHGHPFDRRCSLPGGVGPVDHTIVVDEGPGLSGSSMAAVATALSAEQGLPASAITFFPGHGHGPGGNANPLARRWWAAVPIYHVPWSRLRIAGQPAQHLLEQEAEALLNEPLAGPLCEAGGGRWREHVANENAAAFRDVAPRLEQAKLIARSRSGRKLLFKFAGLAMAQPQASRSLLTMCEQQMHRLCTLAGVGPTLAPIAARHGWLAFPWIEGRRLTQRDANADILPILGRHIADVAGPPLDRATGTAALARLHDLLVCNSRELLGEHAADVAGRAGEQQLRNLSALRLPSYGDGRLAPREWIEISTGVVKSDVGGHDCDHTVIGPQPVLWDIAGAILEWELDREATAILIRHAGVRTEPDTLAYFCAAYAAFRAGIADLCAASHPHEHAAFAAAKQFYRGRLAHELRVVAHAAALARA